MELRIWIPKSPSAWRYCLRHPRSFLIGAYGFNRWLSEHRLAMELQSKVNADERHIASLVERLRTSNIELSNLKRGRT